MSFPFSFAFLSVFWFDFFSLCVHAWIKKSLYVFQFESFSLYWSQSSLSFSFLAVFSSISSLSDHFFMSIWNGTIQIFRFRFVRMRYVVLSFDDISATIEGISDVFLSFISIISFELMIWVSTLCAEVRQRVSNIICVSTLIELSAIHLVIKFKSWFRIQILTQYISRHKMPSGSNIFHIFRSCRNKNHSCMKIIEKIAAVEKIAADDMQIFDMTIAKATKEWDWEYALFVCFFSFGWGQKVWLINFFKYLLIVCALLIRLICFKKEGARYDLKCENRENSLWPNAIAGIGWSTE